MEQKKRRFNVVDIIAVILILAVLVFAGTKLMNRGGSGAAVEQTKIPVTYLAKAEGVDARLYENCLEHLPSKMMASGALVGGEIVSVEKEPYMVMTPAGDWVEDPERVNLIFTATTTVNQEAVMTTKVGDQEIRIGKGHILKSEFIEFEATTIIDVTWGE